jgi:iron complex outermembrane receptor protein
MHFLPELKAVANFGYDELIGRSFGNTDADYLNGPGSGYNNYENTGSRNKLMDLYLNYNKKWSLSILSLKLLRVFLPRL